MYANWSAESQRTRTDYTRCSIRLPLGRRHRNAAVVVVIAARLFADKVLDGGAVFGRPPQAGRLQHHATLLQAAGAAHAYKITNACGISNASFLHGRIQNGTVQFRIPVASRPLRRCVAVVIDWVQQTGRHGVVRILEIVERRVERQPGAHPQEHAGAQPIARRPEIVLAVAGVLQVLAHRFHLLFRFERGQLQTERTAVLVRQEVVELRRVRIHAADKVLDAVQLDGGDALA